VAVEIIVKRMESIRMSKEMLIDRIENETKIAVGEESRAESNRDFVNKGRRK